MCLFCKCVGEAKVIWRRNIFKLCKVQPGQTSRAKQVQIQSWEDDKERRRREFLLLERRAIKVERRESDGLMKKIRTKRGWRDCMCGMKGGHPRKDEKKSGASVTSGGSCSAPVGEE